MLNQHAVLSQESTLPREPISTGCSFDHAFDHQFDHKFDHQLHLQESTLSPETISMAFEYDASHADMGVVFFHSPEVPPSFLMSEAPLCVPRFL